MIITISRLLGSQGCLISQTVAQRLRFRFVWREIIHRAAMQSQAHQAALSAFDELGLLNVCPTQEECQAYQRAIRSIILEIARQEDAVILGRGAQVILKDAPNALHVRLIASQEVRIQNLVKQYHIKPKQAMARIEASDRYRKEYYRKVFAVDWEDPTLYHLVINTGSLGVEPSCDLILHAASMLQKSESQYDDRG